MGKYWQPCTQSSECQNLDTNLECVERLDGATEKWCECREGSDLIDGKCVDLPSPIWMLVKRYTTQIICFLIYFLRIFIEPEFSVLRHLALWILLFIVILIPTSLYLQGKVQFKHKFCLLLSPGRKGKPLPIIN